MTPVESGVGMYAAGASGRGFSDVPGLNCRTGLVCVLCDATSTSCKCCSYDSNQYNNFQNGTQFVSNPRITDGCVKAAHFRWWAKGIVGSGLVQCAEKLTFASSVSTPQESFPSSSNSVSADSYSPCTILSRDLLLMRLSCLKDEFRARAWLRGIS